MLIRKHGLEQLVGLEESDQEYVKQFPRISVMLTKIIRAIPGIVFDIVSDDMRRRYPFLGTTKNGESPGWNSLFKNPDATAAASRVALPEVPVPQAALSTSPDLVQDPSNNGEGPYMDENLLQTLYPWLMEDFQWQQDLQAFIDPQAAAAITGMMYHSSDGITASSHQQQMSPSGPRRMPFTSLSHPESFERDHI
jgi:hypothetical protein